MKVPKKFEKATNVKIQRIETDTQVVKRLFEEFGEYMSGWDGDNPDVREHLTFTDWLDGRDE